MPLVNRAPIDATGIVPDDVVGEDREHAGQIAHLSEVYS